MGTPPDAATRALAELLHPSRGALPDGLEHLGAAVVSAARSHRVSALVARRLGELGALSQLPPTALGALRRQIMDDQHERARLDALFAMTAEALDAAGIPFLALKGIALGAVTYGDPALRPMSDVDLLIAPERRRAAIEALAARGFHPPSAEDESFWQEAYYNLPVAAPGEDDGAVEIHWSIAQEGRHHPDVPGLFARSREVAIAGRTARALGPADLLLHQSLHLSYHYFQPKLGWLCDLALIHGDPPDASETIGRARAWGMLIPLGLATAQVEKVFPGVVSAPFRRLVDSTPRVRALVRLFRANDPVELIRGWERRRRQLLIGLLMLDTPAQVRHAAASWLSRALRYGDREGHRRLGGDGRGAAGA